MLTVYKTGPLLGLPDASPFVVKLETWLRMAGIPYRTGTADMRKAPKGKVPYVADGDRLLGDSHLIIEHLKIKHGDPLNDAGLTPGERAMAQALQSMFEADLYFIIVYSRWWNDEDFEIYKKALAPLISGRVIPNFAVGPALSLIRRRVASQLETQGIGRHAKGEVYAMGRALVEAVSELLGDKTYFLGESPAAIDATAYAMLMSILVPPFDNPVKDCAMTKPNLVTYCERMHERYWAGGALK